MQFFSGTHAIACALFAFLRPGNEVNFLLLVMAFNSGFELNLLIIFGSVCSKI